MRRAAQLGLATLALTLTVIAAPVRAESVVTVPAGAGALVRGGAPLPEFHLEFPSTLGSLPGVPSGTGSGGDLAISVNTPGTGVLSFLFSPRSQLGFSRDNETGTSRSYAELSWNVFDAAGVFGNLGVGGSLTRPGMQDMNRNLLGPPLALHGTVELGYDFGNQHSLSLSLDHATAPDLLSDREHSDLNNLRLRYGLRF